MVTCGRKVKQVNKIGGNLSLAKRKKEKTPVRKEKSTELKDNTQDKLRRFTLGAHALFSTFFFSAR